MDSSTIAAVAALVVAMIALLVATAQVAQQYIGTADLVRKCDSSVYGPLPGKGHRKWYWRQLRFKVLYAIPQLSLTPTLWSEMYLTSCQDDNDAEALLTDGGEKLEDVKSGPGEASWVSFYRAVERSCFKNLVVDLVQADADRCPSDLPVVPMQMHFRDMIAMALMNGMTVSYASPYSSKVLAMHGPSGSLSSAEHPILGTIIHFTPLKVSGNHGVTLNGRITDSWMRRLVAECTVAGKDLPPTERGQIEHVEGRWMKSVLAKVEVNENPWVARDPYMPTGTFGAHEAYATPNRNASRYRHPFAPSPEIERKINDSYVPLVPVTRPLIEGVNAPIPSMEMTRYMDPSPLKKENTEQHLVTFVEKDKGYKSKELVLRSQLNPMPMAAKPVTWNAPHNEVIPWRRAWPENDSSATNWTDASALVPFQKHDHAKQDPFEWAYDMNPPTAAPSAPAPLSECKGINDGAWEFSAGKDAVVIFILPASTAHEHSQAAPRTWLSLWHQITGHSKHNGSDDKVPLLPIVKDMLNAGWRVSEKQRRDPHSVPLPDIDSSVFPDDFETARSPPPAYYPPDFLDPRVALGPGYSLQEPTRLHHAIAGQKTRRYERELRARDIKLIDNNVPCEPYILDAPINDAKSLTRTQSRQQLIRRPDISTGPDASCNAEEAKAHLQIDDAGSRDSQSLTVYQSHEDTSRQRSPTSNSSLRNKRKCATKRTSNATGRKTLLLTDGNLERSASPSKSNIESIRVRKTSARQERPREKTLSRARNSDSHHWDSHTQSSSGSEDSLHSHDDGIEDSQDHKQKKIEAGTTASQDRPLPRSRERGKYSAFVESEDESWASEHRSDHRDEDEWDGMKTNDVKVTRRGRRSSSPSIRIRPRSRSSSEEGSDVPPYIESRGKSSGDSRVHRRVIEREDPDRPSRVRRLPVRTRVVERERSREHFPRRYARYRGHSQSSYYRSSFIDNSDRVPDSAEAVAARQRRMDQIEAEIEAEYRERERDRARERRDMDRHYRASRRPALQLRSADDLTWFWTSQMDIIPGYWATPWALQFNPYVSQGAIAVLIEALLGLTNEDNFRYRNHHREGLWTWLREGKSTFPPYSRNARGGVVVGGAYEQVAYDQFNQKLAPIELLNCYDHQVCKTPRIDDVSVLNRHLELMSLDSWLSLAGRTPEISRGASNLLRKAPALISQLMQEFGLDFEYLELSATEGGLQVIQSISRTLMQVLEDEDLSEAEQVFVLVALLRTVKVALCVGLGPSTEQVREYLGTDMQVFVV